MPPWILWTALGLLVLVILYDLVQRQHAILRNFPVLGHFRYLLESIGVSTGVDLAKVTKVTAKAESFFERSFPGTVHRLMLDKGVSIL